MMRANGGSLTIVSSLVTVARELGGWLNWLMATSATELFKQAMELDEPERARLVTELLSTLEADSSTKSLGNAEWIAEIERRARAALAGRPAVSWNEARKRIEDTFDRE